MKKISILHTGGTLASKVDYKTGGVSAQYSARDILELYPEIKKIVKINSRLIKNMWSQDMRYSHYNLLAKEINKEIKKGVKGIIITHGTDTLHYTSAALSFILEDLPIPVILVGAQRSSDRGSSDATLNLVCACQFIAKTNFAEVGICMHKSMNDAYCLILPGTKTRKLHTSRRDAFKPVNSKPIAEVNKKGDIKFYKQYKKIENKKLKLKLFNPKIKVGILKQHTNMFAEQFLFYKNYDGLVIETTGLGNLPTTKIDQETKEHEKILNALKNLSKKMPIVLSPQTIFGRLNLNVYSNQRKYTKIGLLGNYSDMTTETAFIKLSWLLSNYKKEEVKNLIIKNMRGEISERSSKEFLENDVYS